MKITEGNWEAEKGVIAIHPKGNPDALVIYTANSIGCPNLSLTVADWKAELDANARLMAAAPELYNKLACLVAELESYGNDSYQRELPDWTEAEALLARINGCGE